jgi:hypothetical protein
MRADAHKAEADAYSVQYTKDAPGMFERPAGERCEGGLFFEEVQVAEPV